MATSEGIPSSIDIEFLELNDNPYSKRYFFFNITYWLNFLILDLIAPLLRAKILHNSSIVSPLE